MLVVEFRKLWTQFISIYKTNFISNSLGYTNSLNKNIPYFIPDINYTIEMC